MNREIISSGCADILGGGIVLTGGSTRLKGLAELAEYIFDLPVKVAHPEGLTGFEDVINDPGLSTAIGLILWEAFDRARGQRGSVSHFKELYKVTDKIKSWVGDFF